MRIRPIISLLAVAAVVAIIILGWREGRHDAQHDALPESTPEPAKISEAAPAPTPSVETPLPTARDARGYLAALKSLDRLKARLSEEKTRPNEAVIVFKDADAFRRFLARAAAAGLKVLARLDGLHAARVSFDSLDALAADLAANPDDYGDLDANLLVYPPDTQPEIDPRFAGRFVPFGSDSALFEFLGITGDISKWGSGVTIAVLDSGIATDPAFGTGRVRYIDAGYGLYPTPDNGHGTAVASLAAGMDPGAMGIAPGSGLLSVRVTGADGLSDSFTIAQGVISAVDAGAQIINVSMGSYANSYVMSNAVAYATSHGAVIVASAGNDQATQLMWPAADPRVISVGAVDMTEQQVVFSNSGENLQISAPGLGLPSAWTGGQRVLIDGTSGSAPLVSGAIAAMMSQNPGLTATQAWQTLQRYTSDGGTPGQDPNFGYGILNLGWAMNRNDFNRIDTAVSSQFFDPSTLEMQFVVQNRSAKGIGNLSLDVTTTAGQKSFSVPWLGPGGVYSVRMPVDYQMLRAYGRADYTATLVNPSGIIDAVPANNQRQNRITVVQPQ